MKLAFSSPDDQDDRPGWKAILQRKTDTRFGTHLRDNDLSIRPTDSP